MFCVCTLIYFFCHPWLKIIFLSQYRKQKCLVCNGPKRVQGRLKNSGPLSTCYYRGPYVYKRLVSKDKF